MEGKETVLRTTSARELKRRKKKRPRDLQRPVPPELLQKYTKGEGIRTVNRITGEILKKKLVRREKRIAWAEEQAARTETLLTESAGYIEADDKPTSKITQREIARDVDITSAAKYFELDLDFGPYRVNYTRNGRCVMIGGRKGHVAAFNWTTKKLRCEMNVMEEVVDVRWLHTELMFAVAQKNWVYIYDTQGVELHCLKAMPHPLRLTFLPYHFLLASSNEDGWLTWIDVSIGQLVSSVNSRCGRLTVMTQNPYNATLCVGSSKGVVSFWAPSSNKPLAQLLCHPFPIKTISVDTTGTYMATTSTNHILNIWDVRKLEGPVQAYTLRGPQTDSCFSQRGILALAAGRTVSLYDQCHKKSVSDAYLRHRTFGEVRNIEFCPYEDVLGIGTSTGFTSILVPGSGEPNFDAFEVNPTQSKSQRREAEVKALLDKVQPELISLDPTSIMEVNIPTMKERAEAKMKLLNLKPKALDFTPRKKKRGNTVRMARVKNTVRYEHQQDSRKEIRNAQRSLLENEEAGDVPSKPASVLDRFRRKVKTAKSS